MKTYYYGGHNLTIQQWADKMGLTRATLEQRLRGGKSLEEALTTPQGKRGGRKQKRVY